MPGTILGSDNRTVDKDSLKEKASTMGSTSECDECRGGKQSRKRGQGLQGAGRRAGTGWGGVKDG